MTSPLSLPLAALLRLAAAQAPAAPAPIADLSAPEVEAPPRRPVPTAAVSFFDPPPSEGLFADCDEVEARHGRCVEFVRFAGAPDPATAVGPPVEGELYARLLDEIALRWARAEEPSGAPVLAAGFTELGLPQELWGRHRAPDGGGAVAGHPARGWLEEPRWTGPGGVFPPVAYLQPTLASAPLPPPPDLVRVAGRFAVRLGHDGKPHPYEIMDADGRASAPFFEQLYPYSAEREEPSTRRVSAPSSPLQPFQLPERLTQAVQDRRSVDEFPNPHDRPVLVPADAPIAQLRQLAHGQFDDFARLIGVTVATYAAREHTLNQMRVLTALMAMVQPPRDAAAGAADGRRLVAAARGETDGEEAVAAAIDRSAYALRDGIRLRPAVLPDPVVDYWLARLLREQEGRGGLPEGALARWQGQVIDANSQLLRRPFTPPAGLSSAQIEAWVAAQMEPGADRGAVGRAARLSALSTLVDLLPGPQRDQIETWILLDHVSEDLGNKLDRLGDQRASPDEVAGLGQAAWRGVLDGHGHRSAPIEQGRRAVDPTAICTTRSGRHALSEPVFGAVTLDLIALAPEAAASADEVLQAIRRRSTFVYVDDPHQTPPEISRLVDVPGPQALYRVRWTLWTGWHILWGTQPIADGVDRLAAWTTAICEDTVLADPALAPTLARAGLLDGRFFPTEPVPRVRVRADDRAAARAEEQAAAPTPPEQAEDAADARLEGLGGAVGRAVDLREAAAEGGIGAAAGGPSAGELARQQGAADRAAVVRAAPSEAAGWLASVVRGALVAQEPHQEGVLLFVFHADEGADRAELSLLPHTPYAQEQRPSPRDPAGGREAGRGPVRRSSGWAWMLDPSGKSDRPGALAAVDAALLSPGHRPTEALAVEAQLRPPWRRRHPLDWTLTGSVGGFPLRSVRTLCEVQEEDLDVVAPCADEATVRRSEGLSTDVAGLVTLWWLDKPRLALEWGAEVRVDLVRPGETRLFNPEDPRGQPADPVSYGWTFRPAAGFVAGLRHAARPVPLRAHDPAGRLWGVQRPDAAALAHRWQAGLRAGALFGPGYNGTEATLLTELWGAGSLRRRQGPRAPLTPHHPALLLGPYLRAQWGLPVPGLELLDDGQPRAERLDRSFALMVGLRVNLRVNQPVTPPALP